MTTNDIPSPAWLDKSPDEWPASARNACGILLIWAERKQARQGAQARRGDGVDVR